MANRIYQLIERLPSESAQEYFKNNMELIEELVSRSPDQEINAYQRIFGVRDTATLIFQDYLALKVGDNIEEKTLRKETCDTFCRGLDITDQDIYAFQDDLCEIVGNLMEEKVVSKAHFLRQKLPAGYLF